MTHKLNERRQKQAIFFTLWKEENNNKLATPIVTCDIKVFFYFTPTTTTGGYTQ